MRPTLDQNTIEFINSVEARRQKLNESKEVFAQRLGIKYFTYRTMGNRAQVSVGLLSSVVKQLGMEQEVLAFLRGM